MELAAAAREVIDTNRYMTIATAGADGHPWATPVYYSPVGYTDFYWISSPDAIHSRHIAERPQVAIVIFDSRVEVGTAAGTAVYMAADASEVPDADLDGAVGVAFPIRFPGVKSLRPDELRAPAPHRLYRARVTRHWILDPAGDPEYGRRRDHRTAVDLA
jgi:hypothetical protein